MKGLQIIRNNFNSLIDKYEEDGITVDDIVKKATNEEMNATILCDYFIDEVVKKRVPMFNEETEKIFVKATKDLVRAGIGIGQYGFLFMLTEENFMKEIEQSEKLEGTEDESE